MTGRHGGVTGTRATRTLGTTVLDVDRLTLPARVGRSAVSEVSFNVGAGEVLGLYGLMGAGRTELFESILGVHGDASGRIRVGDREVDGLDVADRIAAGVAMVPEDRQASGLVPTMTVGDNMTLSMLGRLAPRGYLDAPRATTSASEWVGRLRIKTAGLRAAIGTLSGGNQQKVVIARSAMTRPHVLLLDEPTRGVDVGAKAEIIEAMHGLAAGGMAVVFATSDIAEIQAAANRVLVMARGSVVADLSGGAITPDALAAAASRGVDTAGAEAHGQR